MQTNKLAFRIGRGINLIYSKGSARVLPLSLKELDSNNRSWLHAQSTNKVFSTLNASSTSIQIEEEKVPKFSDRVKNWDKNYVKENEDRIEHVAEFMKVASKKLNKRISIKDLLVILKVYSAYRGGDGTSANVAGKTNLT